MTNKIGTYVEVKRIPSLEITIFTANGLLGTYRYQPTQGFHEGRMMVAK